MVKLQWPGPEGAVRGASSKPDLPPHENRPKIRQARQRLYDIRGPIMDAAKQMEEDGQKIIKLNIGNLAVFGFDAPKKSSRT